MPEPKVKKLDGKDITLDAKEVAQFKESLRGELIQPGDPEYDDARKIYNAMIDRRPALIARCADVADVMASVEFAREKKVLLSVRGAGHSGPGLSLCDDGLVIDLCRMKGVRVDPDARTVRVEGGSIRTHNLVKSCLSR